MLVVKKKPVGVDIPIQAFQTFLYNKLIKIWEIKDDSSFIGYGRAYRNANDVGYIPEVFIASPDNNNTQYQPLKFDKVNHRALFFFDVGDMQPYNSSEGLEADKVSVIFITNLTLLKPRIEHRGDEEVSNDVQKLCSLNFQNFIMTGGETGFRNVFRSFPGLINKDGEVFEDRHPLFCFKFNFDLYFNPIENRCI